MPAERRAVLLLLCLAVGGQGVRLWVGRPGAPPGEVQLFSSSVPGHPVQHRDSGLALGRPLAPGERIDLDRASDLEIARLPRVGLSLARTIIRDREGHGPFGSLEGLDRVPGIGPGLLGAVRDHVSFSGSATSSRGERVNLNAATVADLERLPFIGPGLAGRIVAFRERHGPFPAVDSLVRVPGVGPVLLGKVRNLVRVSD